MDDDDKAAERVMGQFEGLYRRSRLKAAKKLHPEWFPPRKPNFRTPERAKRQRQHARGLAQYKPHLEGRIRLIERRVQEVLRRLEPGELVHTGQVLRAVYCAPNPYNENAPVPEPKHFQYERIRAALLLFAEPAGYAHARGQPRLWKRREHELDDFAIRKRKKLANLRRRKKAQ